MLVRRREKVLYKEVSNAFISLLLKNQENIDVKTVAVSCHLCSAVAYFRVFLFLDLNFQIPADVPESCWIFWKVLAVFPLCCFLSSAMIQA